MYLKWQHGEADVLSACIYQRTRTWMESGKFKTRLMNHKGEWRSVRGYPLATAQLNSTTSTYADQTHPASREIRLGRPYSYYVWYSINSSSSTDIWQNHQEWTLEEKATTEPNRSGSTAALRIKSGRKLYGNCVMIRPGEAWGRGRWDTLSDKGADSDSWSNMQEWRKDTAHLFSYFDSSNITTPRSFTLSVSYIPTSNVLHRPIYYVLSQIIK